MKKSKTIFACAMLVTLASCSNDHVLSQQSPTPSDPDVINIVAASSKAVTGRHKMLLSCKIRSLQIMS